MKQFILIPVLFCLSGCGAVAVTGVKEIKANSDWASLAVFDADKDEAVSLSEFQTLRQVTFDRFDEDRNGVWSGAQYRAVIAQMPANKRIGKGDLIGVLREPLTFADTNGDGAVTRQEFQAGSIRLFTLVDKNGDGALQRKDYSKVRF
ncbi:hypothetical protein [Planktotalea arctica]|uniref:hypothetical protein n=1 Tax=Planktotalea arctica TaxID=1481893 RepID=UPI003219AD89